MQPVVEILAFTATDAYLADNSLASTMFEYIKKLKGFVKGFRGFAVEDPTQGYYVVVWDSFASFEAVEKREDFPAFLESLNATMKDNVVLRHVEFDGDTTNAFNAPITEYSIVKPKEGKTQADVDAIVALVKEVVPSVPTIHSPVAWGPFKQSPEFYALATGWDSLEAYLDALKAPPVNALMPKIFETADFTVVHLALQPMK